MYLSQLSLSLLRQRSSTVLALALLLVAAPAQANGDDDRQHPRGPNIPSPVCDSIHVPSGHRARLQVHALGVQIYRWTGTAWEFLAPEAELFAGPCHSVSLGIHYAGPTWEAFDGSRVVAVREAGCAPFPGAIPWLLLAATESSGRGVFGKVTYIQRINTIGGTAPAAPGSIPGEEARVPYSAEYVFYSKR